MRWLRRFCPGRTLRILKADIAWVCHGVTEPSQRADRVDAKTHRTLAELRQRVRRLGCQAAGYCFGFSAVGFNSDVLAVAALGFEAAAAMTAFGRQKSAATLTISSAGLLSSGEKRLSADSLPSTESAFTWRNFL